MTLEELILKIIQTEVIQDQKTLLKHIFQQGYEIDQSTLSRLFKKLKIQKHLGKYVSSENPLASKGVSENKLISVPPNLIIINTKPGFANAVSVLLDENPTEGVAGTVAGDDTIFVAILPKHSLESVKKELEKKLK